MKASSETDRRTQKGRENFDRENSTIAG